MSEKRLALLSGREGVRCPVDPEDTAGALPAGSPSRQESGRGAAQEKRAENSDLRASPGRRPSWITGLGHL